MDYSFKYTTKAMDIWKLSMYGTYGSMVGFINIIFTIAMILLAAKYWMQVGIILKIGIAFRCWTFYCYSARIGLFKSKKTGGKTSGSDGDKL